MATKKKATVKKKKATGKKADPVPSGPNPEIRRRSHKIADWKR